MSAFTTIESIERWYIDMNMPVWSLFSTANGKKERVEFFEAENVHDGWPRLKRAILDRVKGVARLSIYLSISKGNTNGVWQDIELYEVPQQAAFHGIGSVGSTGISEAEFEKRLASERELWKLKRDIEDLQSEKKNSIGAFDRLFNSIAENPTTIAPLLDRIAMIVAAVRGVPGAIPAPVNGMPKSETCPVGSEKPTDPDDQGSDDDEIFKGYSDEDVAIINHAVNSLKKSTGHNPAHVLAKLAGAIEKDPSLIQYLNQL